VTRASINDAQYDPDTASKLQKPNKVRGLFDDMVGTPRLTGTRWFAFADAAACTRRSKSRSSTASRTLPGTAPGMARRRHRIQGAARLRRRRHQLPFGRTNAGA
jgi:hypothetical protein